MLTQILSLPKYLKMDKPDISYHKIVRFLEFPGTQIVFLLNVTMKCLPKWLQ